MDGLKLFTLLKYIAVLVAAMITGSWFLSEVKKAKFNRQAWYKPYFSIPGLIILAALSLPIIFWLISR
jgi:hypothetical protein